MATAMLTAGASLTASAQKPPPPDPGQARTITLVSGDRVRVEPDGRASLLSDKDAVRHEGPDGTTVIPADAIGLVSSGRVDRRLFNITQLARQGYDDDSGRRLPSLDNPAALRQAAAAQPTTRSRTAVTHPVTFKMIGRDGRPVMWQSTVYISDLDNDLEWYTGLVGDTLQLPPGRYAATSAVYTAVPGQARPTVTSVTLPEFTISGPRSLDFDARPGGLVDVKVERRDAKVSDHRLGVKIQGPNSETFVTIGDNATVYSVASKAPHLRSYYQAQVAPPAATLTITAPERTEVPVQWLTRELQLEGVHELQVVDVGHARPEDLAGKDLTGKLALFTLDAAEAEEYAERVGQLAANGAKAAVLHLTEVFSFWAPERGLPVVISIDRQGSKLSAAHAATLEGRPTSPYSYNLVFPHQGGSLPPGVRAPANHDLAVVDSHFHAMGNDKTAGHGNIVADLGSWKTREFSFRVPIGARQTRYFSPGITWSHSARYHNHELRNRRSYPAGPQRENWGKGALTPALNWLSTHVTPEPLVHHTGGMLYAQLPLRSDSAGHRGYNTFGDTGVTRVFADGKQVGENPEPGGGEFEVPAGAKEFRLTSEVIQDAPKAWLGTKVTADWTTSARVQGALPLLTIGFDPAVDIKNTAPAGRRFSIPVTVARQFGTTGPAATVRSVDVSYDDGASWQPASLTRTRTGWSAGVTHPAKPGPVSLRATADAPDGNSVAISTIRAYLLR
ncbi:hypothetical protein HPO96_07760 [Kribbella sandramycini]|uniref:Uncharacterized protein n=1 Tax=Kribbella sandramycini TaxID=60450 RepID=A0A7Y4KX02_9ACTN|nr:hypothetical protein [Kribbella sandramycini]MBB6567251.1 hypothetical protein [Kribbella sandramycini]NOL40135.1 hypothetical protein [Kribbella sandramycini]